MRVLSAEKWPTESMAFNGGSAGSLQRSGFRENPTSFSPSVARWVHDSIFRTNDAPEVRCDLTWKNGSRQSTIHIGICRVQPNTPGHSRRQEHYWLSFQFTFKCSTKIGYGPAHLTLIYKQPNINTLNGDKTCGTVSHEQSNLTSFHGHFPRLF